MTAALLLLVPLSAAPTEPTPAAEATSERQVAEWVANLGSKNREKLQAAYEGLLKAKPKSAVPALTKLLGEKDAPVYYVADILGAIGPDAKDAVPALLALVPKDSGGFGLGSVALALARIDAAKPEATRALLLGTIRCQPNLLVGSQVLHEYPGPVVQHLVALCADKDAHVRAKAAEFLGTLKEKQPSKVPTKSLFELAGDSAKGIAPALEKLLADENTEVKLAAARAISHVAPELTEKSLAVVVELGLQSLRTKRTIYASEIFNPVPQQALKVLLPLLDDPSSGVRRWAISHVSQLPVREPIEDALKNGKTARVRESAAQAIGYRYGSGAESIPALKAAVGDTEFAVRFAAGVALVQVAPRGNSAHAAIPALVEGLQQKSEDVRIQASQNLLRTGPAAKDALPALAKLLDDQVPEVRFEAALALVGIDPTKAAGGVPALVAGVKSDNNNSVLRGAKALAVLGPVAKDAVPELLKKCDAKAPQWRLFSAEALVRIDPAQTPKAVAVLVALLKEKPASFVHRSALTALRRIGPGAKPAMPALTELLADNNADRADVAVAMIVIDPDSTSALAWVRKVLTDESSEDRYDLIELLSEIGAAAKPLVPELTALLKSKAFHHRKHAVAALEAIGADAKDALPELKELAQNDPRQDVRTAAATAVKKIEAK